MMIAVTERELVRLSDHEWRVGTSSDEDGVGVLGYVERIGEYYEVLLLSTPTERRYFEDLDSALQHVWGTS